MQRQLKPQCLRAEVGQAIWLMDGGKLRAGTVHSVFDHAGARQYVILADNEGYSSPGPATPQFFVRGGFDITDRPGLPIGRLRYIDVVKVTI